MRRYFRPILLTLATLSVSASASRATELLARGAYAQAFETASADTDALTAAQAALAAALYGPADSHRWLERAVTSGRAAVHAAPHSARPHLELGTALCLQAGRGGLSLGAYHLSRECRAEYERSLALDPALTEARAALARWHSGAWAQAGLIGGGNPKTARRLAQQALAEAPQNLRVVVQVGTVYLDLEDITAARALLERSLTLGAQDAQDRDLQSSVRATLARLGQ